MLPFWASRCFRSEFRRVLLALAARTASVLVGRCFGRGVFAAFPAVGIIGSPCVGAIEPRSRGCIVIGPADFGLFLGILNTASGSVTIDVEGRPLSVSPYCNDVYWQRCRRPSSPRNQVPG